MTPDLHPHAAALAEPLLAWFDQHARDLPWRAIGDSYRVWVSEIMLQQTQVETVLRYYAPFLTRFPTVEALANASEADVLAAWSGLGFYRRAKNLHRAAQQVVTLHDGVLPTDPTTLRSLPGLGRYTVGAILSLAHGQRLPILDGNVARVLSRVFRVGGLLKSTPVQKQLWLLAEQVLPLERVGPFNESLMELGALVCRPTSPRCPECPLAALCGANRHGDAEAFPQTAKQAPVPTILRAALYLESPDGRFRIVQRPPDGLLASMWELPTETTTARKAPETAQALARSLGARGTPRAAGQAEHRFSHRLWRTSVFRLATRARAALDQGRWVEPDDLDALAVPTATRKVLRVAWSSAEA